MFRFGRDVFAILYNCVGVFVLLQLEFNMLNDKGIFGLFEELLCCTLESLSYQGVAHSFGARITRPKISAVVTIGVVSGAIVAALI